MNLISSYSGIFSQFRNSEILESKIVKIVCFNTGGQCEGNVRHPISFCDIENVQEIQIDQVIGD